MFGWLKSSPSSSASKRIVEVGWIIDTQKAGFIWASPGPITRHESDLKHAKSVGYCPAVIDYEARFFEVTCPFDIEIRFITGPDGRPGIMPLGGDMSSIRASHLNEMLSIMPPKEWRHPSRPVLQFRTPYLCVTDETVYITQMPPVCHYANPPWPGILLGGRFPLRDWPRHLMWAFEWHDINKPLIIKRGEPWFYLRFETEDPSRPVRLIEAEMTPALVEHISGMKAVTNYVKQTYSLFNAARARRPKTLLTPKNRG